MSDCKSADCSSEIRESAIKTREEIADPLDEKLEWWQAASVYQVLIPSFKDTSCDGTGDLNGVIENIEYLADLGVDIIWLSPIYDSPMYDIGYDIRNYTKINPLYGTLDDVDRLIKAARERGLKVIIDIALNHTSVEHDWFRESRENRRCPNGLKRDWYIWHPGYVNGKGERIPPNNWASAFGGSAWTFDPVAGEYYLHIFGDKQADVNWENAEVRQEFHKILRWWLDRGLDGFRLDCMNLISKTTGFPDAPRTHAGVNFEQANVLFANLPRVHEYLQELYEDVFSKYNIVTIGEMSCGITSQQAVEYLSKYKPRRELNLLIQFAHVELDSRQGNKWLLREWELPELKRIQEDWQGRMLSCGAWPTLWMENHDQPRGVSRFTTSMPRFRRVCAKLLCMWLCTLRGTPLIYQGQELGMVNPSSFSEERNQDVETVMYWKSVRDQDERKIELAKNAIIQKGRDNSRIPLPWSEEYNKKGYCRNVKPWSLMTSDELGWCIDHQLEDSDSVLNFYRSMLRMRKSHPALLKGTVQILDIPNRYTYAFIRHYKEIKCLIVLNFSPGAVCWSGRDKGVPELAEAKLLLSNYATQADDIRDPLIMRPYEGALYELRSSHVSGESHRRGVLI